MANEKPMIGLVIMIGLPGSGKTTLTQSARRCFVNDINSTYDVHVVSYDELIPVSIQSHSSETSWKAARQAVSTKVSGMIKQLKLARLHEISFCQIYLNLDVNEALRINRERQKYAVPEEVIKRMSTRIQPPNVEQNLWELHSLILPAHSVDFTEINRLVDRSLADPVKHRVDTESRVEQSIVHTVDLELRSLVSRLMRTQTGDRQCLRERAAWFNGQRQRVLAQLRAGDLCLPSQGLPVFLEQQFDPQSSHLLQQ